MTKIVIVDINGEKHTRIVESWDLGFSLRHFANRLQLDGNEVVLAYVKAIG